METDAFDAAAADLLRVPPGDFVVARGRRVEEADAGLAERIRGLRKPTVAAWAVNLLGHDAAFREALELSAALRDAQDDLDAVELARLGTRRRALVAQLARRAADLAGAAGVVLSTSARDQVERTLNVAIVDAAAGAVVAAGRLVRTPDVGSVEAGLLADCVAGSIPGGAQVSSPPDELAERRARRAVEQRSRAARRHMAEAEGELARADEQRAKARERADRLHERAEGLRRDLARVLADIEVAEAGAEDSDRAVADARTALAAAERAVRAVDEGDGEEDA